MKNREKKHDEKRWKTVKNWTLLPQPCYCPTLLLTSPATAPACCCPIPATAPALLLPQPWYFTSFATAPSLIMPQPCYCPRPANAPALLLPQTCYCPSPATAPALLLLWWENWPMRGQETNHVISGPMRGLEINFPGRGHTNTHTYIHCDWPGSVGRVSENAAMKIISCSDSLWVPSLLSSVPCPRSTSQENRINLA